MKTRASPSPVPRKKPIKSKRNTDLEEISRVLESMKPSKDSNQFVVISDVEEDNDDDDAVTTTSGEELGFRSTKDLVWAKSYPYAWWPGWIQRAYRGKFLVSFFGSERSLWCRESEIRYFSTDFKAKIGGQGLPPDAIDLALAEFQRRLISEVTCPCQREVSVGGSNVQVENVFHPAEAFKFVRKMAVSPSFEEVDSVDVIRVAARVNAFRRYAFVDRDCVYEKTMRILETDGDSETNMESTCFEDEKTRALPSKVNVSGEEEAEEERQAEEERHEEEEPEVVELEEVETNEEEPEEEEPDKVEPEEEDEEEYILRKFVEQRKTGSVICKKNSKELPEQWHLIEKSQAIVNEGKESEEVEPEEEDDEEYTLRQFLEQRRSGSVICKKNSTELPEQHLKERSQATLNVEEEPEEVEPEDDEEEEYILRKFVEQRKSGSVICNKNSKALPKQQHLIERPRATEIEMFQPVEVLAFVHRMAVSAWVDDADTAEVVRKAAKVNSFRRHAFIEHDWIYRDTMRLNDESKANMKSAFSEDELTCELVEDVNISDEENNHTLFVERVKRGSGTCKGIIGGPLHDILKYLYCVALDPFYAGSEGYGVESCDVMCQRVLRYRALVYQDVLNLHSPLKDTSLGDCVSETPKARKRRRVGSISNQNNLSANVPVEENVGVGNDGWTQKSQLSPDVRSQPIKKARVDAIMEDVGACDSKKARVDAIMEDVGVCDSGSNVEDVEPVASEIVDQLRDITDCKSEFKSNTRSESKDVKACRSISNAEGRDIINLQRDIPGCNGESECNKRQKTVDAAICSRSPMESGPVVDNSRDTPDCNGASKRNKRHKTDNMKDSCSIGNTKSRDADHLRYTPDSNSESESNKRQKISTSNSVPRFHGGSTEKLHGGICDSDGSHESNPSSNAPKPHLNIKPGNRYGIDGRHRSLKVDCGSNNMLGALPGENLSEKSISTQREDRFGVVTSQHPTTSAASDLRSKEQTAGTVSGASSEGVGRFCRRNVDMPVRFQQEKTLRPLTMLYSSPLSAGSPTASAKAQIQSPKIHTGSESPTTLHMMFPKNFNPPSREELVKQFRRFGPIDYSKTKIFFYTGSAQIVFKYHLDAEAACHYAKRKKIFTGGANVRYWLNQHEHSRRGTNNSISGPSSTAAGPSIQNLKSCLRISNPQQAERKHLHVKFPSLNHQDVPSASVGQTKQVHRKEVGPDISPQMVVLLEKCNQVVTRIKSNLGIQSFYSLFTHDYCGVEVD